LEVFKSYVNIFILDIDSQIAENEALKSLPEANQLIHLAKRVISRLI